MKAKFADCADEELAAELRERGWTVRNNGSARWPLVHSEFGVMSPAEFEAKALAGLREQIVPAMCTWQQWPATNTSKEIRRALLRVV